MDVARKFTVLFVLIITQLFSGIAYANETRIRDLNAQCGLYVVGAQNTSTGLRVADLNAGSIREYILTDPDLDGKELFLVGTPIYGKDRKALIQAAKLALQEQELKTPVRVISRPQNVLERFRFLWLMPEDYQTPTREEITTGISKLALSGTTPIIVLLLTQNWIIAIPAGVVNLLQSALVTFWRRTFGNWHSRSYATPERFFKQLVLSVVFTMGIYFSKNWQELGTILTPEGLAHMAHSVYAAVLFQTLWRTLFHNGVYAWEQTMTQRGRDGDGRRTSARLEMLASLFTTPFWIHSTITQDVLFDLGFMKYNVGHLGMSITAAVGAYLWTHPKVLDPSVKLLDTIFGKISGIWVVKK